MQDKDRQAPASPIPVTLVTGFLGSGKTTLLNSLVGHSAMGRALVLINEFGEVGLDHDLMMRSAEDVVVEMSSGCLCCTIRSDLVETLRDAPWRFARGGKPLFDRVVIETTGLADPAPILYTLLEDPVIARTYRLDGVITLVDAATGLETLDRQDEAVKQVVVADKLILTKLDLVQPADAAALEARLDALNPGVPMLRAAYGRIDPAIILNAGLYDPKSKSAEVETWLNAEAAAHSKPHDHSHHHHDVNRHGPDIKAVCLISDEPMTQAAFVRWYKFLTILKGPDLLRVKGLINIRGTDGPLVLHSVQHVLHPPVQLEHWPSDDKRTRIVLIGKDLDEADLTSMLENMTAPPPRHDQPAAL